ncbi:ParB N-terminal domain-containing protein [Streptomyces sp. NPDC058773]|uniref:ParB N-terminal domain-containing protein n=1 Tax=Streptomyces sp. NPDC058773 TaxID=3346632 RepID=UPI0036BCC6B1
MEQAKIRLSDIKTDELTPARFKNIDGLTTSIRTSGLREPVMVAEKDHLLLSGARRFEACKRAHVYFVDAIFPSNVVEGSLELRRHFDNPDPLYSLPMNVTERVEAAFLLHRLPPPVGEENGFRRDAHTAAAAGLPPKIYAALRSTIRKAGKGEQPPLNAMQEKARKTLSLMVEAVENPPPQFPLASLVGMLHQLLLQEICPDTLESCFPYLNGGTNAKDNRHQEGGSARISRSGSRAPKKEFDYIRTADVVTGTLEGLSCVITDELTDSEHYEYVLKALKEARRMSHVYVKKMEKMRNE